MSAFPPELALDEDEVLRGGFGGVGIVWTIVAGIALAATVVLVPLALFFWARSGRYVLTDRQLYWKPSLGKARTIPLEELRGQPITIGNATETVQIGELALRWQRDFFMLWGALQLLTTTRAPERTPPRGPEPRFTCTARRRTPTLAGAHGMATLIGDELSFLPFNPNVRQGDAAKLGAGALIGVRTVTLRAQVPVDRLLRIWGTRGDRAANVRELAAMLGGVTMPLSASRRQPTQHGLAVAYDDEHLELTLDAATTRALA